MSVTVARLHKELGKLVASGHGRKKVCVAKDTFRDNREGDGCTILDVAGLGIKWVNLADDDGCMKINRDGSEAGNTVLILAGSSGVNGKGELIEPR
jgi:hypothetical protein